MSKFPIRNARGSKRRLLVVAVVIGVLTGLIALPRVASAAPTVVETSVVVPQPNGVLLESTSLPVGRRYVSSFLDTGYLEVQNAGAAQASSYPLTGITLGTRADFPWGGNQCGVGATYKWLIACFATTAAGETELQIWPPRRGQAPLGRLVVAHSGSTAFEGGRIVIPWTDTDLVAHIDTYTWANGVLTAGPVFDGSFAGMHRGLLYLRSLTDTNVVQIVNLATGLTIGPGVACPAANCVILDATTDVAVLARGSLLSVIRLADGVSVFDRTHGLTRRDKNGVIKPLKGNEFMVTRFAGMSGNRLMWSDLGDGVDRPDLLEVTIPVAGPVTTVPTVVKSDFGIMLDVERSRIVYSNVWVLPPGGLAPVLLGALTR